MTDKNDERDIDIEETQLNSENEEEEGRKAKDIDIDETLIVPETQTENRTVVAPSKQHGIKHARQ